MIKRKLSEIAEELPAYMDADARSANKADMARIQRESRHPNYIRLIDEAIERAKKPSLGKRGL